MTAPLFLDVPEVAQVLRVSEWTVRKLIREGALPAVAGLGDRKVVPYAALEEIAARTVESFAPKARIRLMKTEAEA